MSAAAFTIFWMQIKLEEHSLVFCSSGAVAGMIFGRFGQTSLSSDIPLLCAGLEVVDIALSPPQKKLGFVCIWFSFAFALFLLNRWGWSRRQIWWWLLNAWQGTQEENFWPDSQVWCLAGGRFTGCRIFRRHFHCCCWKWSWYLLIFCSFSAF